MARGINVETHGNWKSSMVLEGAKGARRRGAPVRWDNAMRAWLMVGKYLFGSFDKVMLLVTADSGC